MITIGYLCDTSRNMPKVITYSIASHKSLTDQFLANQMESLFSASQKKITGKDLNNVANYIRLQAKVKHVHTFFHQNLLKLHHLAFDVINNMLIVTQYTYCITHLSVLFILSSFRETLETT